MKEAAQQNMNDLTFRSQLLANPQQLDEALLAYLEANPEQKSVVQQARDLDKQIKQTLAVDVPEGLQARILLNRSYQENAAERDQETESSGGGSGKVIGIDMVAQEDSGWSWTGWSALAASFMAVTVLASVWQSPQNYSTLQGEDMVAHILEHIEEEPDMMQTVKLPETEAEMQSLFAKVGATLERPIESMSYAGICVVEGQKGLHIVMQEQAGPVTVIVMPGQQAVAMQAFETSGYHGELIPVKGGVVAIVANTMEQVALAQLRFFMAVKFA